VFSLNGFHKFNYSDIISNKAVDSSARGCSVSLSRGRGNLRAVANRKACNPQSRRKAGVNALERLAPDCAIPNLHPRKVAQSVVRVGPPRRCTIYSVSLEPNPYRLVMQVRKLGGSSKAQESLFPAVQPEREKLDIIVPPPTSEDLQLRTRVPKMRIVVDAGHGGWDLGTVGRRGLLEKDLVLEIAQRLGKLLESRLGAKVILTRNSDNYIPLDERAGMANQSQADLFVSVHANYSDLPSARGVETYYTNFSRPPTRKTWRRGKMHPARRTL
jgi:N-acetylmuramoyl-L-alanine amidase